MHLGHVCAFHMDVHACIPVMIPRPGRQRFPGSEKTAEESRLCHPRLQCRHHHHHHHQKCPHLRRRLLQQNNKAHRSKHLDLCMQVSNGDASASVVAHAMHTHQNQHHWWSCHLLPPTATYTHTTSLTALYSHSRIKSQHTSNCRKEVITGVA